MCCYANTIAKKELLRAFGKRKTIKLWKIITSNGKSENVKYQYSPGVHKLDKPLKKYDLRHPHGFHVFTHEPYEAKWKEDRFYFSCERHAIPVVCHKDHLIRSKIV